MKFSIPTAYIEAVEAKLAVIARKCEKLGCAFEYKRLGECRIPFFVGKAVFKVSGVEIEVSGTAKINGWSFVAEIEHHSTGNIVRTYGEAEAEWFTCEPKCEHCHTKRDRSVTYIVEDENGNRKQVGKSCLMLYTNGLSAEMACSVVSAIDTCRSYEQDDSFLRETSAYSIEDFVKVALDIVRTYGYDRDSFINRVNEAKHTATEEQANEFIAWASAYEPKNDFERNAINVFKLGYVELFKHGRILGAFIAKFVREQSKSKLVSEWLGEVGQRIEFTITNLYKQVRILYFKTVCVGRHCHEVPVSMITADNGSVIIYAGEVSIDYGTYGSYAVKVVATIKSLGEYKGVKQTVIQRPKVSVIE